MSKPNDSTDVAEASRRFLTYVLLPAWMLFGFADYLCHRKSKIERTSGTHESMTHMLMIASAGAGVTANLLFEMNATVLAIITASALAHETIVLWDIAYAAKLRPPSATEQHIHSFLEVLPFTGLVFTICLHPEHAAELLSGGKPRRWELRPNRHPLSPLYSTVVMTCAFLFQVLPHTEELIRCFRVDHTILPHDKPIDG